MRAYFACMQLKFAMESLTASVGKTSEATTVQGSVFGNVRNAGILQFNNVMKDDNDHEDA